MRATRGIVIWGIFGGYRLLGVKEQLEMVPVKRQERAIRQVGRGIAEVSCTPTVEMNEQESRAAEQIRLHLIQAQRRAEASRRAFERFVSR